MAKPERLPPQGRTIAVRVDDELYQWLADQQALMFERDAIRVSVSAIIRGFLEKARESNGRGRRRP